MEFQWNLRLTFHSVLAQYKCQCQCQYSQVQVQVPVPVPVPVLVRIRYFGMNLCILYQVLDSTPGPSTGTGTGRYQQVPLVKLPRFVLTKLKKIIFKMSWQKCERFNGFKKKIHQISMKMVVEKCGDPMRPDKWHIHGRLDSRSKDFVPLMGILKTKTGRALQL